MGSLILRTATRYLLPLMVLYSVLLLFRGHHEPGGGFVGGLVAASALVLCALAFDVPTVRRGMPFEPGRLIGAGLATAAVSGLPGVFRGEPYFTGAWGKLALPVFGLIELGTPLLFDVGVYLTVLGVVSMILLTLAEEV